MDRIGHAVGFIRVGDEQKHKELQERLRNKLRDALQEEFAKLRTSKDWQPSEAAACAMRALQELLASMLNMIAANVRRGDFGQEHPALTEAEYGEFWDETGELLQRHIDSICQHLHQDN